MKPERNENSILKLKSNSIKIEFIPFDQSDEYCFRCESLYTETLLFEQKYCKKFYYIILIKQQVIILHIWIYI